MSNKDENLLAILGPTNTGKTYTAFEKLFSYSSGIFGFPLRLLARENYDKAVKRIGLANVALITGEEKILPKEAKYLMGFDDKYALCFGHSNGFPQIVSDTQAYKQFGNSVVPLVIEEIMQNIITEIVRYKLESKLNFI